MKKILILTLITLTILVGCNKMSYTPTSKVEDFLSKYQKLDKNVLKELENMIEKEEDMSEEEKKEYQVLLEKQYQNLSYKIKNEIIKKDTATVDVEIEVLDYSQTLTKANKNCEDKNTITCRIKEMKLINNKIKYNMTFTLYNEEGNWQIEKLENDDIKKLHGLY